MNPMTEFKPLVALTLKEPIEAVQQLLGQDFPKAAIWSGFLLVQVLFTMVFVVQDMVLPMPDISMMALVSPQAHLGASILLQLAFATMITFCGRWLQGSGTFLQVLTCMAWLQFLQVIAFGILTVLMLIAPAFANLLSLGVSVFAFYLSLHFVNAVHNLGSLWRAFGVILLAGLSIISLIFALLARVY
ncbi:Yip1 domain-containing protein [Epibacterium ulvae]|uniref:Yip1 domain-containing protein n=1 Tax=Epibacterium ulvae TaxID=1156985 RepID=A0A1G5Q8K9_9RHOB|nr:YIP1 family protein [Epibacterium ulvae]SCZ57958.1 Yip1 domain-containing protein [Epibacterium ulvae]